ncbi:uncharacterized protein LOC129775594 [Toxorhynchites rutilus septentrionalis]|uniref:uncharacterized protein LOC129775594 n=1 Tax=Toxorhynchites rutilus septentrionalis TaxID=329112 RepID=UPI0024783680|nr:uncharacterized protein LOC129775594 [Toxorhynchites rutilus septentrionalis]XP_055636477.1 uncharacterized protein LOC129775594 [Toxorhynchites rutilus septentrionalis]XP_055636478.1 uncharacterized protein LOC129775594 [Toxorhynchites rutilus septentrionalis]XP_055636479.1 uncharacterized protein LOC129775594 [Toxorhynchites rutilus septentrionalis]
MSPVSEAADAASSEDCSEHRSASLNDSAAVQGAAEAATFLEQSYSRDIEAAHSPASSSSSGISTANFSVINYVGKIQKQSNQRSTVRCRTPYERQTLSRTSCIESADETTSSSIASSLDDCSATSGSIFVIQDAAEMADAESDREQLAQQQQPRPRHGPRSRRSLSVSSSGCSSTMDDRNRDLSPIGSINSCRCTSLRMSDFDDDGFREDNSVSSEYSVFSSSRPYQPHHPLHCNHQNVPHHPNNTRGLYDIALRTVKLIRRNQELQMRLVQLQQETNAFIDSVMANPENETLRSQYQKQSPAIVVHK